MNCTNTTEVRSIEKYLYKIRCEWENKISSILIGSWE
jgi:hypothetical protein